MLKKSLKIIETESILSRRSRLLHPIKRELVVAVRRKIPVDNWIHHQVVSFKIDINTGYVKQGGYSRMPIRTLSSEADIDYGCLLTKFASEGYVSVENANVKRPIHICEDNWDFETDLPKQLYSFCHNAFDALKVVKEKKVAQSNPASSWYSGQLPNPESLAGYVGTSTVDATQLTASFNGVHEAVQLVNQFDSSLLKNVAFIFNTTGGAYGVYVPWLDEQIKNAEVKSLLKRKGFIVDDSDPSFFTAYSKDQSISEEDIKKEIENAQSQVRFQGGNTFGINMSKIMAAANADAKESGMLDPQDLYDIAVLHLGATIVHEAVHAKGSSSEGPSEASEVSFTKWALPILNKKKLQRMPSGSKPEDFKPFMINENARRSWYDKDIARKIERKAQYGAQFSNSKAPEESLSPWAGIMWDAGVGGGLESLLGVNRYDQGPPRSFEKRLREKDVTLPNISQAEIIEMLLEKDHDEVSPYQSIEDLLEERRPKPLAIMVDKVASSKNAIKTANEEYNSTFGWMNNLDLPMAERMIPEEEADEFLSFDWKAIRKQPRYNPEYDRFGMYYRFYEPRINAPELWDRMVTERNSTSPAMRFAEIKIEDGCISEVFDVLTTALNLTLDGTIAGTRFICGEKVLQWIDKFYAGNSNISVFLFPSAGKYINENIYPLWVVNSSIPEKAVILAEGYVSGKTDDSKASDVFEHITGLSRQRKNVIDSVLKKATELTQQLGIDEIYIVGSYPRAFLSKESWANVLNLEFSCSSPQDCVKFGEILAKKLGVSNLQISKKTSTLMWEYKGLGCSFKGKWVSNMVSELMSEVGMKLNPIHLDVYSRDFTINMFVYKLSDGKVYDISGQGAEDMQRGLIRTYFKPEEVLKRNPITILRAIKYACRYGFEIEKELKEAMTLNANRLIDECEEERLLLAYNEIMMEGSQKAIAMLNEYKLEALCKIKENL